jgi:ATP-dependent protease ClpP protease subunit
MFEASHSARYQRQSFIRELEELTAPRRLLCFIGGKSAEISKDDIVGFVDLLHNIPSGVPIDLLLHTVGGDIDAAEKLIRLVRARVGDEGEIRVIIPDLAKSAGTLLALGANTLVMSDSSEIGTIDPQVWLKDSQGNNICQSILSYLSAYREHAKALNVKPDDVVARTMMDKFDPNVVRKFQLMSQRARNLAEGLLKRRGLPFSEIAGALLDLDRWPSHGQMINWEDAKALGLDVNYLPPSDNTWQKYWLLHCHQRLSIDDNQKLFESAYVSLPI